MEATSRRGMAPCPSMASATLPVWHLQPGTSFTTSSFTGTPGEQEHCKTSTAWRTLCHRAGPCPSLHGDFCRTKCPTSRKETPKDNLNPRGLEAVGTAEPESPLLWGLCSAPRLAPHLRSALGLFYSPERHMESWISFLSSFN